MAAAKGAKKEKVFHPNSRKAGQVERGQLRKAKMAEAAAKKTKRNAASIDKYTFFYHALPPEEEKAALTLEELHDVVKNAWLTRHDFALEQERSQRRKGRPKSVKETSLENQKVVENEEYRTGLELPDLTHEANVQLFRRWDQGSIEFIDLLRFFRINSENSSSAVVSQPGKHKSLLQSIEQEMTVDS